MALPVNIEDLLTQRKVESNRIEFKKGWNPEKIYRSICAFANDFDNIGGGYILVGIEEENGVAMRPVLGLSIEQVDSILKDMVNYNNKLNPYYLPRTELAEIDGKTILVIWCPSGINRPYDVPDNVVARSAQRKCYIRSGSSTIEAKGYVLDELRDMANRVPFDDRGNPDIKISDISGVLVLDYLNKIGSRLAKDFNGHNLEDILEQMDLFVGPRENRMLKNVAAMMFCENPEKFFPYTQVEIVIFPDGVMNNPNNLKEVPPIKGAVPQMIEETMRYLSTVIIQQHIVKPKDKAESIRLFNYPYQALEEAVSNALYHRDYRSREPIVIEIQPKEITISSASGPHRSISFDSIKKGERMVTRYYRNRRLGEFLKELGLTEGRSTGIPTIQKVLAENGSPAATFNTNEERSYFEVTIPCREGEEGISATILDHKETAENHKETAENHKETAGDHKETAGDHKETVSDHKETAGDHKETVPDHKENHKETVSDHKETAGDHKETVGDHKETVGDHKETAGDHKETVSDHKENHKETVSDHKEIAELDLTDPQRRLLSIIAETPSVTLAAMAEKMSLTVNQIRTLISQLEKKNILIYREGATKNGVWRIKID